MKFIVIWAVFAVCSRANARPQDNCKKIVDAGIEELRQQNYTKILNEVVSSLPKSDHNAAIIANLTTAAQLQNSPLTYTYLMKYMQSLQTNSGKFLSHFDLLKSMLPVNIIWNCAVRNLPTCPGSISAKIRVNRFSSNCMCARVCILFESSVLLCNSSFKHYTKRIRLA